MKTKPLIIISFLLLMISCSTNSLFEVGNATFKILFDRSGNLVSLTDIEGNHNYLSSDTSSPILSIKTNNQILQPTTADYDPKYQLITLHFANNIISEIKVEIKKHHIIFELVSISSNKTIELVIWGPYHTTINKTIGETVGVVQGEQFSVGLQALNAKTLGGYPWNDNDCMPQINLFEQDDYTDMSEENKSYVLYRVEAAKPTKYGSSLQAYCRNRDHDRVVENLNHERYIAPAYDDGGIIGSKIALFACPVEETLETIGVIEIEEGLPHPSIDRLWTKQNPEASSAYIILDFGEDNIDQAIEVTRRSGLKYLYHSGPFKNWGHFELKENQFPNGYDGLKYCVEKAKNAGIHVGVHTLSNFITTNDPYVTPIPDKRLAKVGSSIINEDIDSKQSEIPIKGPDFFNQFKNNHLKTVLIDNELIQYGSVSENSPWKLLDCTRGAFGTSPTDHNSSAQISKLCDHGYKVFLTDIDLSKEVASNIARLYNYCGLSQISFDGLEGNRSTGMGNYGEILFTQTWYDSINENIRSHFIADASRTDHFFWHIYTRMNWGEPWYAGFRESQTTYRLKNQAYFKRNLMPGMLGWYKLTAETSIEDTEWMLARSAAFDAGYAFVVNYENLEKNKNTDIILKLLGEWEKARMSGAFTQDQKKRMEDINNEFHLESIDGSSWELTQVSSYKFRHTNEARTQEESSHSTFSFENHSENGIPELQIRAVEAAISNIQLSIDDRNILTLPTNLQSGETFIYDGGKTATIYSPNWEKKSEIQLNPNDFRISKGAHIIHFDCTFYGSEDAYAAFELRLAHVSERVP